MKSKIVKCVVIVEVIKCVVSGVSIYAQDWASSEKEHTVTTVILTNAAPDGVVATFVGMGTNLNLASQHATRSVLEDTNTAIKSMSEFGIKKILPQAYANFEKRFAGDLRTNDAEAALLLMTKTKALADTTSETDPTWNDALNAHRAAWRLCLGVAQRTSEVEAKTLILAEWNHSLDENKSSVGPQVYALADIWNHSFETDAFWRLLQKTNDKRVLSGITFLVYAHGDVTAWDKLIQKLNSGIDLPSKQIIQNALNWKAYNESGRTDPGPAALSPNPTMN